MFGHTNFVQSLHLPLPAMSNPTPARTSATFSESVMASEAQIISRCITWPTNPKEVRRIWLFQSIKCQQRRSCHLSPSCSRSKWDKNPPISDRTMALEDVVSQVDTYHDYIQGRWMHPWKFHMECLRTAISKEANDLASGTLFFVVPCCRS